MTTTLNLSGDYETEVLSWYIWGQNSQPPRDKVADSKQIDAKFKFTTFITIYFNYFHFNLNLSFYKLGLKFNFFI